MGPDGALSLHQILVKFTEGTLLTVQRGKKITKVKMQKC